ncbi:MAG TPA: phosphoribosylanthranilate isomerase [Vicinamibacterales bacterium]|nr:phosphoribosylanthranilate isomerase [Vicinamibacterales bacterium]
MFVKICGITRIEDAHAAVSFGADAVGFVFWPKSPRFIDPYRARAIAASLPPFVTAVGLFVNQPPDHIASVASLVRLGAVQLHGDETPSVAVRVGRPVVRALSLQAAALELDAWPPQVTILLDAHDPERRGGTGRTIDWDEAAGIASRRRIVLAGGLNPENIAEAVDRVRPFGVDVSSGVESAAGIKDIGRLRALFEKLHGSADPITARS